MQAFRGVEHVLEHVATLDGVAFFNDTKATNVEAARQSLLAFTQPVLVILGGRYKGGDFALLAPALRAHGKRVLAIGEAQDRIAQSLGAVVPVERASSLEDAVTRARAAAAPGRRGPARARLLVLRHVPGLRRPRPAIQGRRCARLAGGGR